MLRDPDSRVMEKAYARWAPVYDVLCGPVFLNGRRAAARAAREVGGRILEVALAPVSPSTTTTTRPRSRASISPGR